jgi:TrmH family RNA methyltransferase
MLTSTKNSRIQTIRKLQSSARFRRKEKLFVVEGVRLVEEAFAAGMQPQLVLFTEDLNLRGQLIVERSRESGVEVLEVALHVFQVASDTQTPQGVMAVLPIPVWNLPEQLNFVLIADGVRDPGNLGTLIRTASAAGVDALILPPENVDPFAPKVVRAGMGAHFRLPIRTMDWQSIKDAMTGLSVFLADVGEGSPHFDADFQQPLALIIGGEAVGAGREAANLATQRVHIPMPGETESLNAAVAGAIIIYEIFRQRSSSKITNY